jgi:hypothetical protein
MKSCQARRGFFSLRDCGERAVKQCAICTRQMCSSHLSPQSGFTRCLDCEGRAVEREVLSAPPRTDDALTDPAWAQRYRDRYYSRARYAPVYLGTYHDPYYDRYDTRSFDSDMASSGPSSFTDRDSGTGLGDS